MYSLCLCLNIKIIFCATFYSMSVLFNALIKGYFNSMCMFMYAYIITCVYVCDCVCAGVRFSAVCIRFLNFF